MTGHRPGSSPDQSSLGRHTRAALGAAAVTVGALVERVQPVPVRSSGRRRAELGILRTALAWARPVSAEGIKVSAAEVGMQRSGGSATVDAFEVYTAASRARRSARDTVARLAACSDRMGVAIHTVMVDVADVAEELSAGATRIIAAAGERLRAIEEAERRLVDALDVLDAAKTVAADADRALRRFAPYGGTLVVTLPTRTLVRDRFDRATARAVTSQHRAENLTYTLVKEIITGERAVRAVDYLVDHLLDHGPSMGAASAPPAFLRVVRAALPPSQQLDWWRELWSLFNECLPDERQAQATSQLLNAPRTIWAGWATARRLKAAPRADEERRGPG